MCLRELDESGFELVVWALVHQQYHVQKQYVVPWLIKLVLGPPVISVVKSILSSFSVYAALALAPSIHKKGV